MQIFEKDTSWHERYNAIEKLPTNQIVLFACDVARLTLPIWERKYPEDNRPRTAIETAEQYVYDKLDKATYDAWTAENKPLAIWNAIRTIGYAMIADSSLSPTIQRIYQQTMFVDVPITPALQSIAEHIRKTRNFEEYQTLLDKLKEVHNITLPREVPLGLSHYVLFTLTNTH